MIGPRSTGEVHSLGTGRALVGGGPVVVELVGTVDTGAGGAEGLAVSFWASPVGAGMV
ncbi:MAG: hypothetical protein ACRDV9_09445 [Acidimicrobiia bacterium]